MGDYNAWPAPLSLVENAPDGKLQMNPRTMEELNKITDHVVVVGIAGLYRTGKSYLMNRLAGQTSGFDLGSTVQSKTKGIWVWCVPHPRWEHCCLILLDTEGLDDVEKGNKESDVWIFALTVLLSSTLVYNSKGTIDQHAIDDLHFVTEITDHIKISTQVDDDEGKDFDQFFPSFVWAVRDFDLDLEIDGRKVSEDDYLEHALKLKTGAGKKVSQYNMPRECIKTFFVRRKCFVFPKPVATAQDLRNLENLAEHQLDPEFVEQSKHFLQHIFEKSDVKNIDGKHITGRMLAGLTKCYVDAIRNGAVPCIESAVEMTAKIENQRSLDESIMLYRQEFARRVQMPTDSLQQMSDTHHACIKIAAEFFLKLAVFDYEKIYYQKLMQQLDETYEEQCKLNEQASRKRCVELLQTLQQPVCDRLKNGVYARPGGYHQYKQDTDAVLEAYRANPHKGVMADEVLCEFAKLEEVNAASVLKTDELLTDEARKLEEEQRNAEAQKRAAEAAEEARKKTEMEMADKERSHKEHIQRIEAQMAEDARQQRLKMEEVLEKRLNEQKALMEQGFRDKARAMDETVANLKRQIEEQQEESSGGFFSVFEKIAGAVLPIVNVLSMFKGIGGSKKTAK